MIILQVSRSLLYPHKIDVDCGDYQWRISSTTWLIARGYRFGHLEHHFPTFWWFGTWSDFCQPLRILIFVLAWCMLRLEWSENHRKSWSYFLKVIRCPHSIFSDFSDPKSLSLSLSLWSLWLSKIISSTLSKLLQFGPAHPHGQTQSPGWVWLNLPFHPFHA